MSPNSSHSVKSSKSRVAYMEEEDDDGNLNNKAFATSTAGSPRLSSAKMNISRKKSSPRENHDLVPPDPDDSDTTDPPSRRESRASRSSRRTREPSAPPTKRNASRPDPHRHSNTVSALEPASDRRRPPRDQHHYYEPEARAASRPRSKTAAPRPSSYYGPPPPQQQPMHPPASNSRYNRGMAPPPLPHRSGFAPPPFAPPQGPPMQHWQQQPPVSGLSHGLPHGLPHHSPSHSFGGYSMMSPQQPMRQVPPPLHHEPFQGQGNPMLPPSKPFDMVGHMPPPEPYGLGNLTPRSEPFGLAGQHTRDLQQRFARPQTSIGHRPPPPVDYDNRVYDRDHGRDPYDVDQMSNGMRRLSMGYKPRYEDPGRAMSARPQASPFAPPALPPALPPARERSTHRGVDRGMDRLMDRPHHDRGTYDDRYDEPDDSYYESSVPYDEPPMRASRHRRESMEPPQYSYESRPYTTDLARTSSRRDRYYNDTNPPGPVDDKMRLASSYQEDRGGGVRLTADLLYEAERDRQGPRSRSTRSSGSRDESDWRQSATTRTTRTSTNEEDYYSRMRTNNAYDMQYQNGTEINTRRPQSRYGDDQSVFGEYEERPSRYDRPPLRNRAASRPGSIYAPPENTLEYSYGGGDYTDDSPFAPLEVNKYIRDL